MHTVCLCVHYSAVFLCVSFGLFSVICGGLSLHDMAHPCTRIFHRLRNLGIFIVCEYAFNSTRHRPPIRASFFSLLSLIGEFLECNLQNMWKRGLLYVFALCDRAKTANRRHDKKNTQHTHTKTGIERQPNKKTIVILGETKKKIRQSNRKTNGPIEKWELSGARRMRSLLFCVGVCSISSPKCHIYIFPSDYFIELFFLAFGKRCFCCGSNSYLNCSMQIIAGFFLYICRH